jgi:hypothetical protein
VAIKNYALIGSEKHASQVAKWVAPAIMEDLSQDDNAQDELIHNGDVKKEDADEFSDDEVVDPHTPALLRAPRSYF